MRLALTLAALLAAGGSATDALRERDAEVRAALPAPGKEPDEAARRRIEAIVARTVDLRGMLQAALGPRWGRITEKQRRRLLAAFEKRFRAVGGAQLDDYRSAQIEYLPEEPEGDRVRVPTRLTVKGETTPVAYLLAPEKGGWRIVDVVVDGVSTVGNYRASFARVIAKEGVDGLAARLERGAAAAGRAP